MIPASPLLAAGRVRATRTQLVDGRELIYFDDRLDAVRELHDAREPSEPQPVPEMRYDATLGEWVSIASHRQDRTFLPPTDECPLCPSAHGRATEVPASDYDVVVFENRFPSFAQGGPPIADHHARDGGLFARQPASGRCEVVCFTADHGSSFSALTPARVRTVIEAWAQRTRELSKLPDVEQVFPFENRGEEIGVSLTHPHGQIYAYPFVTPRSTQMITAARRYRARTGRDLPSDVLAAEQRSGERIVARSAEWTAFVPVAARWPIEVHLYPNRRTADLDELDETQRDELASVYLDVLGRIDRLYATPTPYIAAWYQAPVRIDRELACLHLRLFSPRRTIDKLKYLAASEAAMGAFINDVVPEHAAQILRDAVS